MNSPSRPAATLPTNRCSSRAARGTRLTVTGTARRQSPTGTGEGPEVTFSAQTLDATTPRTCHIITYDAKNAGSATLTITLGEDYTDTRTLDCEVNEGAIDDTEKK